MTAWFIVRLVSFGAGKGFRGGSGLGRVGGGCGVGAVLTGRTPGGGHRTNGPAAGADTCSAQRSVTRQWLSGQTVFAVTTVQVVEVVVVDGRETAKSFGFIFFPRENVCKEFWFG